MVSLIIFILIVASGSTFAAIRFRCAFGYVLPITCMSCILLLFVFGVFDLLVFGVYLILIIAAFLYICSIAFLIIQTKRSGYESVKSIIGKNFFSMGFLAFILFICLDFYCVRGAVVSGWDDLSHWATTVKQMTLIDKLSTAPAAVSVCYKHYLPGTALFQYLFQKINEIVKPDSAFSEWRLFFAQHVLIFSFITPVCELLRKKVLSMIGIFSLLAVTLSWSSELYINLQVDYLLSLVFAAGLFSAFFYESGLGKLFTIQCISFLVLIKTVGLLLAVFLAVAFVCVSIDKKRIRNAILVSVLSLLAIIIPKVLWNYNMAINGVVDDAGTGFDLSAFIELIQGKDNSYRVDVAKSFFQELLHGTAIELCGIRVSYIVYFVLTAIILILLSLKLSTTDNKFRKCSTVVLSTLYLVNLVYAFGLMITYLYHFSPREALGLASFHRYIGISLNAMGYLLVFEGVLLLSFMQVKRKWILELMASVILFAACPYAEAGEILTREHIHDSYILRYGVNNLCEKAKEFVSPDQTVYFVHQGSTGYTFWLSRFIMMPTVVNPLGNTAVPTWNFGETEDDFTKVISADDFRKELLDTCDYVLLNMTDDYFVDKYSVIFEDGNDIHEDGIYKVDRNTGKLSLVAIA